MLIYTSKDYCVLMGCRRFNLERERVKDIVVDIKEWSIKGLLEILERALYKYLKETGLISCRWR